MVLVFYVISQNHVTKEWSKHYGWKLLMVTHQFAKLGGYRNCGTGDIMTLGCHMISQDHVMKGSCDFMGRSPS